MNLASGITNPTSLRTSFARELQTKPIAVHEPKGDLDLNTHGPASRHGCRGRVSEGEGGGGGRPHNTPLMARICFAPCSTYGNVFSWAK